MQTKLFAHRGASQYAPENTMAAFKLAVKLNAEGIETDVHLTKDSIPVIIHDEKIDRTTNHRGFVKDFTYNELTQFDSGSWFSNSFSNEKIIKLEHFLIWAKTHDLAINIELKNNKIDYPYLESIVYEQVDHFGMLNRTIFSTFNKESIQRCQNISQTTEIAWLTSKRNKNLIKDALQLNVKAIHIHYRLLNRQLIQQAYNEKIAVRVFTINKTKQLLKCFDNNCDAIFTDVPDLGTLVRNQYNKEK